MPRQLKFSVDEEARYIETNVFRIRHSEDLLTCQMRLTYNTDNGAAMFIRKKGESWIPHSWPWPGQLPKSEVEKLFELFRNSALKCDPKVKFKLHKGVPKK